MLDRDLAAFVEALSRATREVPSGYFQVPVAGSEAQMYRERVYCYELYHRLRLSLPEGFSYSLSGEVDKSGHPLIRKAPLNRRKPDFLVHSPGDMDRNLVAIEVKPANLKRRPLLKDLETITACLQDANYEYGILLVYGDDEAWRRRLQQATTELVHLRDLLDRLFVYWHRDAGTSAAHVPWSDILATPQNNALQLTSGAARMDAARS